MILNILQKSLKNWEKFWCIKEQSIIENFLGGTKNAILQNFYTAAILIQNISAFAYKAPSKILKSLPKVQPNTTFTAGEIKRNLIKIF